MSLWLSKPAAERSITKTRTRNLGMTTERRVQQSPCTCSAYASLWQHATGAQGHILSSLQCTCVLTIKQSVYFSSVGKVADWEKIPRRLLCGSSINSNARMFDNMDKNKDAFVVCVSRILFRNQHRYLPATFIYANPSSQSWYFLCST